MANKRRSADVSRAVDAASRPVAAMAFEPWLLLALSNNSHAAVRAKQRSLFLLIGHDAARIRASAPLHAVMV